MISNCSTIDARDLIGVNAAASGEGGGRERRAGLQFRPHEIHLELSPRFGKNRAEWKENPLDGEFAEMMHA